MIALLIAAALLPQQVLIATPRGQASVPVSIERGVRLLDARERRSWCFRLHRIGEQRERGHIRPAGSPGEALEPRAWLSRKVIE